MDAGQATWGVSTAPRRYVQHRCRGESGDIFGRIELLSWTLSRFLYAGVGFHSDAESDETLS